MTDLLSGATTPPRDAAGLGPWRRSPAPAGFRPFPDEAMAGTVADRFLQVSDEFAAAPALRSPAGQWTYAELRTLATGRAAAIRARVGSTRQPVAVLAAHDGPLVATILAIILADEIVVVLDPAAPVEQAAHALRESGAALLVHDAANASTVATLTGGDDPVPAALLDDLDDGDDLDVLDGLDANGFVAPTSGPADTVMLAFTSGTSGLPKAGAITNAVLLNVVRGATNALGIGPDDRMPMLFPTSLAVAAYPLFIPLLNGGSLATLDVRSVGLAPIADFLTDERITLAYLAPTVVRFLVDALGGRRFPDLRMIALGGEVVDADVVRLTKELLGPELIANGFGTTETGVLTLYVLDPDEDPPATVPAGYAAPDVELLILDEAGQAVAPGTSGEVAITTPLLFAGYWGHPELNATVIQPDPKGRPGWNLYRTGDLGTLDEAGALTVLGRLDTKVKVRGRFVVLGDVEAMVHELDAVGDGAVLASQHGVATRLTAIVTPAPGSAADGAELRAQLLERFEAYRVPEQWIVVADLPRLPNGKIDRQALRLLAEDPASDRPQPSPVAATATEAEVLTLWKLLLPQPPTSLDDDFFHLGGHSLLAAQMLVMLEEQRGTTVPMSAMVDARTVRQVAAVIDEIDQAPATEPSTVARVQAGHDGRPRLWFVHDLPGSAYRVRHVAHELGADIPVWSFESPLLRGEPNRFADLDEFVDNYVQDLVRAQPEGPYWLGGYSFGGICAYQMARQLRSMGHQVAFLAVVDVGPGYRGPNWKGHHSPPWPYFGVAYPPPPGSSPWAVVRHYASMVATSPRGAARHLTLRTGLARPIDRIRFARDLKRHGRVRPSWRLWYAWEEHWHLATRAWDRSNTYDGTVHLLWADQTEGTDATMGWGPLVGDLQIHRFPGFHDDLLEEHGAPELGRALRALLDAEPAEPGPTPTSTPTPTDTPEP